MNPCSSRDDLTLQITHRCECGDITPDRDGKCVRCRLAERADQDVISRRLIEAWIAPREVQQ